MNVNVDLRELALRRAPPVPDRPVRRHLLSRYVLPGVILLAFVGLAAWAARSSLRPSVPVTVVPVLTTQGTVQQEGTVLFQTAGWVEPRPTPIVVTALTEGVIDELLVVEGQAVKAGEVVARLIDTDARLALEAATADRQLREAELASARATLAAARINVDKPVRLEAAVAEADALLARAVTELKSLPYQVRVAEARQRLARLELEGKSNAAGVVPALVVQRTQTELDSSTASAEEMHNRLGLLEREVEALTRKRDALRKRLELRTDELRLVAEGEASVKAAEARLRQAEVTVKTAELRLQRSQIRAATSGRVLALVARPGARLMGLVPGSQMDASTVVTMYEPGKLQVRADVRLEDVPRVQPGQIVRIETPAVTGSPLQGEVLFATSQADIQKNTLQVKVAITSPPQVIKPDMLVRVTFLAPAGLADRSAAGAQLRILIPRSLIRTDSAVPTVWLADQAAGVARLRPVKLGGTVSDELVEVVEGLGVSDKLIAGGHEGLADGVRIRVVAEDGTLGAAPRGPAGGSRPVSRLGTPNAQKAAHH